MNSTALSGTKHLLPWRDSSWCLHSPSHSREKQLFIWGFVYFIFFISVLLIWRQTTTTLNSRHFMPRVFFFQVPLFSPDVITAVLCMSLTWLYFTWCFYFVFGPICCLWALCPLLPLALKRPQQLAALPTPAFAGSLLLFHLIAADSV